uniref:Tail assembly chaperone n=1 Tax=viral metagenome TaxID=1070528 RepID=A0A6M3KWI1_9ZZZZ
MTEQNVLVKPKAKTVRLSDGKDYTLSPFNLNTLANLEEAFDCDLGEIQGKLSNKAASSFRKLLHVLLADNHPELSLSDVGRLVEMDALADLIPQLTEALGKLEK